MPQSTTYAIKTTPVVADTFIINDSQSAGATKNITISSLPVSTPNQTALDSKLNKAGDTITGNLLNTATGFFQVAVGTTAQRPTTPLDGMMRFNTTTGRHEFNANSAIQNHARLSGDTFTGTVTAPSVTANAITTNLLNVNLLKYVSFFEAKKAGLTDKSLFINERNQAFLFENVTSLQAYPVSNLYVKSTIAVLTAGKISQLTDQSGNNNHATQVTPVHQPIPITSINFGLQAAKFTNPTRLTVPNFFNDANKKNLTIFTVDKADPTRIIGVILSLLANLTAGENDLRFYFSNYDAIDNRFFENFDGNGGTKVRDLENRGKFNIIGQPGPSINMISYNGTYLTMRSGFICKKIWAIGDMNFTNAAGASGRLVIGSREIASNGIAQFPYSGEINEVFVAPLATTNQHQAEILKMKELNDTYNYYPMDDARYTNLVIVGEGNSIGDGNNCPFLRRYMDLVMKKLKGGTLWLVNQPGRSTQDLNTQAVSRVDVLNGTNASVFFEKANILIFDEFINDMKNNQIIDPAILRTNFRTYCINRKNANKDLKIFALTPRERTDPGAMGVAQFNTTRKALIELLVKDIGNEPWIDGLVRCDLDARIDTVNVLHYTNITLEAHPNEVGHQILAEMVYQAILPLI